MAWHLRQLIRTIEPQTRHERTMAERRRSRQTPEATASLANNRREVVPFRRPCSLALLRTSGRRTISKRVTLAQLLLAGPHQHVNVKVLPQRVPAINVGASPATARKALNQFREARLLHDVTVAAPHAHFDFHTVDHRYLLVEEKQRVIGIRPVPFAVNGLFDPPKSLISIRPFGSRRGWAKAFPYKPDGRAIWKPPRPSSHFRHAGRVDVASAPAQKPCPLVKGAT
ncbi:hypothetical protein MJ8_13730 [Mesorhizobium sp. J8]|nr:hypothetical protein MJ8_13730 [Mesorhizobium sp. J8]